MDDKSENRPQGGAGLMAVAKDGTAQAVFRPIDLMPADCRPHKVIPAIEKAMRLVPPIAASSAFLLSLTPFERGYVLGVVAESHSRNTPKMETGGEG